jgi:SAM-dependent methyltransferase
LAAYASAAEPIEPIPETSPAERLVADVQAIGAPAADAERVRDSVPLWFHTFALAAGVYTPGIARDHGYRLAVLDADRFAGRSVLDVGAFDVMDLPGLGERFDVALCFGILHRVTNPIALLRALADVLAPGGEVVLETYGSRLAADAAAIEVHDPGDVYPRDDFVYWGFSPEGLRGLARIVGLDEVEVVDELEIDGHPRILALLRAAG